MPSGSAIIGLPALPAFLRRINETVHSLALTICEYDAYVKKTADP
jgi:hypothetical protein